MHNRQYLTLENGIPSHDTFGRVFAAIDAKEFAAAFQRWVRGLLPALEKDEVISLDGKTSRRSGKMNATPLHLVSAFAAGAGLVLGQRATAEKSNEKTAIPELLATLALTGCIVTIDAMGDQVILFPIKRLGQPGIPASVTVSLANKTPEVDFDATSATRVYDAYEIFDKGPKPSGSELAAGLNRHVAG